MNQLEMAIHSTVHDFEGKTEDLAEMLGMGHQVMINKANFNNESSFFSPLQLALLQEKTGNNSINIAMQAMFTKNQSVSKSITYSLLSVSAEVGRVADKFNKAASDSVMTDREKADCIKQAKKALDAVDELLAALHAQPTGKIRAA